MRKLILFYIFFIFSLPLTGCYADRKQLENSNPHTEDQPHSEQDKITPSYTTIYEAIKNKDLKKAIALLQEALKGDKEVDFMQVDDQGRSLLHFAIVNANSLQEVSYLEIINLLIQLKQDINVKDKEANTPLHIAASKGLCLVADVLLKNGANIYAENKDGEIPLHYAAKGGSVELVRLLIDQNETVEGTILIPKGSDGYIDKKNKCGRTPLYLVIHRLSEGIHDPAFDNSEKYVYIVNLLVASGADVHTKDKYCTALLHMAAGAGYVEIVRILLEQKVEINACNEKGNSPLELTIWGSGLPNPAIKNNCLMIANMLIEAGANVHHTNKQALNLLHIAAMYGNVEMVELLISHKVEINSQDKRNCTPLHFAVEYTRIEKQQCYLQVLGLLIQGGAIIDIKNKHNFTPLQKAIKLGLDKIVIRLINKKTNINSLLRDVINFANVRQKDTYIALVEYLLNLGADVNFVDTYGNTALHDAVERLDMSAFPEIIKLLIEAGADMSIVNKFGISPWFYMKRYVGKILL